MRSYARWGFLRGSNETQILPKSGEKFRHQPVFFYARAEGQALRNHLRSLTACCGERENITRSHNTASPRAQNVIKYFPSIRAQQKAPAWGKGLCIKRVTRGALTSLSAHARLPHELKPARDRGSRAKKLHR